MSRIVAAIRTNWIFAVLLLPALAGCGQQKAEPPQSTTAAAPDTTATNRKLAETTPAAEEHGAAAPVASISAADPVALWREVRSKETELGTVIQKAQLNKVHHLAFAIRDRVIALGKTHGPMAKEPSALEHQVDLIRAMAANLDELGDKGDLDGTQVEFAKFEATLRAIENSFPPGMLGKE